MSIHDFEDKILKGKFGLYNNLKIDKEYYQIEQFNQIEKGFIKIITVLNICLVFLWLI